MMELEKMFTFMKTMNRNVMVQDWFFHSGDIWVGWFEFLFWFLSLCSIIGIWRDNLLQEALQVSQRYFSNIRLFAFCELQKQNCKVAHEIVK